MSETNFPPVTVIVGAGRSGTTYLARVVKQAFDIGFSGEPKFVVPAASRAKGFGDLSEGENLRAFAGWLHDRSPARGMFRHLDQVIGVPTTADDIVERVLEPTYRGVVYAVLQLMADKRGRTRLGYKDPADTAHVAEVAQLLPTAKIIHIIRDGRDVAMSTLKFDWGPTNVYVGAKTWADVVAKAGREGAALGDRYYEFRFEDFVGDPGSAAKSIASFLEIDDPDVVANAVELMRSTVDAKGVFAWRNELTRSQRMVCEAAAGDQLRQWSYETEFPADTRLSAATRAWYIGTDFTRRAGNSAMRRVARR